MGYLKQNQKTNEQTQQNRSRLIDAEIRRGTTWGEGEWDEKNRLREISRYRPPVAT